MFLKEKKTYLKHKYALRPGNKNTYFPTFLEITLLSRY